MKKNLLELFNKIDTSDEENHERILLIDGLNLFFRNFSAINAVNSKGIHIGGLGGFFRSLGFLINSIQPTKVYVVMDGIDSSKNRKNIIPEYKSGRNISRITKHELFDDLEEEDDSKINQIVRIIQYLETLPVITLSIPRVEADDVIAYLSKKHSNGNPDSKIFIVSSDKDYIQLISKQIILYRPTEKEYYTEDTVIEKFGIHPKNFLIYKLLLGDNSDKLEGVKGLGPKKIYKYFPELQKEHILFDDLIKISESKLEDHVIYSKILHNMYSLNDKYKIMDLSNPMMSDEQKSQVDENINNKLNFYPELFVNMCNEDQIGNLIRNTDYWVKDTFKNLI
jgi:DNA polymerase-1